MSNAERTGAPTGDHAGTAWECRFLKRMPRRAGLLRSSLVWLEKQKLQISVVAGICGSKLFTTLTIGFFAIYKRAPHRLAMVGRWVFQCLSIARLYRTFTASRQKRLAFLNVWLDDFMSSKAASGNICDKVRRMD
ncbi:MAG: hypothetical protein WCD42_06605 [Rhizomicrobium sp.]